MQENNVRKINNQIKNQNHSNGKFSYQVILRSCLVVILAGLIIFTFNNYKQNHKIKNLLEKNTFDLAQFSNHMTETRSIVDQNQNTIKSMQDSLASISSFENQPLLNMTLLTLQNLIIKAESDLRLDRNIKSTIEVLQIADKNLSRAAGLANTDLAEIRQILKNKIAYLSQIKTIDLPKIVELLNTYQVQIDSLKLADFLIEQDVTPPDPEELNSTTDKNQNKQLRMKSWKKWFAKIRSDFISFMGGLIRIRSIDGAEDNVLRLLDESQINLLKIYFKLQATLIKTNFLQHNNKLAADNIELLMSNTNLYFHNSLAIKKNLIDLLEKIKTLNIESEDPADLNDLSAKVNTLANANRPLS